MPIDIADIPGLSRLPAEELGDRLAEAFTYHLASNADLQRLAGIETPCKIVHLPDNTLTDEFAGWIPAEGFARNGQAVLLPTDAPMDVAIAMYAAARDPRSRQSPENIMTDYAQQVNPQDDPTLQAAIARFMDDTDVDTESNTESDMDANYV